VAGTRGDGPGTVQLVRVRKAFGDVVAVEDLDLTIADGEFFSLLGPSGSGKTTVLRMIAGFEKPTAGAILLGGQDVTSLAPYDRDVNTVFQDYALFPHMTVQQNVEYGLKVKGVARASRRSRAGEMLEIMRLSGYGSRRPNQLSGGQRQRVALARALVNEPRVLLLDEPLGALDLKLREEMQVELRTIQREVGITFVFVTHDQGEALSMSSRVAVFSHGKLEQVGTPREIYEHPATSFVAHFVGSSNLLDDESSRHLLGIGGAHTVRPERIRLLSDTQVAAADDVVASGTIADVQYLGADSRVQVELDLGGRLAVTVPSATWNDADVGTTVSVAWPRAASFAIVVDEPPEPPEPDDDTSDHPDSTPITTSATTFVNNEGETSNENQ
jgi:putative spermidine/putrescine transport system ATP-binding protein